MSITITSRHRSILFLLSSVFCLLSSGADWPQWRGPNRDDISHETGLLKSWPEGGPPLLWRCTDAGIGYSGPSVVGVRLFTMGARGNEEFIFALDTATGKQVWSTPIGPLFRNGYGDGPRGTPTVDTEFGLIYALGGQGKLICVDAASGAKRWEVDMYQDLAGQMMSGWGYAESLFADWDKLICTPGGAGGTVAALDKKTGKVLWRSKKLTDTASYSSSVVADIFSTRQYIVLTGQGIAGVAADDGHLLWHYVQPSGKYRVAVVATPIVHDNNVYVSADYNAGCDLIKLVRLSTGWRRPETVYSNHNMENHHGGVILIDGYLYGCSGNTNQRAHWVCQKFDTGRNVWEEGQKLEAGSLTCADGMLYLFSQHQGTAVLIEASPQGWKEHGRFSIPQQTTQRSSNGAIWTHPVVANGHLYLRDQELLYCYDVRQKK
jgi:outer membrane protein assembly factor BamB